MTRRVNDPSGVGNAIAGLAMALAAIIAALFGAHALIVVVLAAIAAYLVVTAFV